ncbi:MAG: hypothetical protein ACJ735_08590 [Actinomycetes bacterium]
MPAPAPTFLSRLRGPSGGLALRTRVAAALIVVGLIVLTAPIVVVPVVRTLVHVFV